VGVGGSDWFLGQTPIAVRERCSLAEDCVAVQSIKLRFVGQRRPNSQILLQVFGRLLRRALDIEGFDEGAVLVHQIDDRTVVH
jgi:hypothetical protein